MIHLLEKNIFILTYKENLMSPEINPPKCGYVNKGAKNIQPSLHIHWVLLLGSAMDTKKFMNTQVP